jgi:hypothetical protein
MGGYLGWRDGGRGGKREQRLELGWCLDDCSVDVDAVMFYGSRRETWACFPTGSFFLAAPAACLKERPARMPTQSSARRCVKLCRNQRMVF